MLTNIVLKWFNSATGALHTGAFVNGQTYVSEPVHKPKDVKLGAWAFDCIFLASSTGQLSVETSNTPEELNTGGEVFKAHAPSPCRWFTYAPTGFTIAATTGADIYKLNVNQAKADKRARLKFVASGSGGGIDHSSASVA